MAIRVVVAGLAVDPGSKAPMVVLKEVDGERAFPIWIGLMEASAIAARLEGAELPRPMTHDLLASMVRALDARVAAVKVSELRGNTFYAIIYLERDGETLEVDARPSDAIALALRTESPIFVAQEVLEQAHQVRIRSESGPEAQDGEEAPAAEGEQPEQPPSGPRPLDPNTPPDKWTEILENLDPEAFGKYKM